MQRVHCSKNGKITRRIGEHSVISDSELDHQTDTKHIQEEIVDKRGLNTFAETQSCLVLNALKRGEFTEPEGSYMPIRSND